MSRFTAVLRILITLLRRYSDPIFHCDADLDPASQNDADSGPRHCFTGFLRQERRVAKGRQFKSVLSVSLSPLPRIRSWFFSIPDPGVNRLPDPDPRHFYAVRIPFSKVMRIRIQLPEMMRIQVDPDPQRCFTGFLSQERRVPVAKGGSLMKSVLSVSLSPLPRRRERMSFILSSMSLPKEVITCTRSACWLFILSIVDLRKKNYMKKLCQSLIFRPFCSHMSKMTYHYAGTVLLL